MPANPRHETEPVLIHGKAVDIDREMVDFIKMVNYIPGIRTNGCCQGNDHPGKNVADAYFDFYSDSWMEIGDILFNKIHTAIKDIRDPATGKLGTISEVGFRMVSHNGFHAQLWWNKRCTRAIFDALKPLATIKNS